MAIWVFLLGLFSITIGGMNYESTLDQNIMSQDATEETVEEVETNIPAADYDNFRWFNERDIQIGIFRIQDGDVERDIMFYTGPVKEHSTEMIRYFIDQYPDVTEITLASPGGVAVEGLEMGNLFSEKRLSVTVSPGRMCMSACAYAFLGGTNYRMDGILGFHGAWADYPLEWLQTFSDNPREIYDFGNEAQRQGQYIGTQFSRWFMQNGFNSYMFDVIIANSDPENFVVFTHEDDLMAWYVRDDASETADGVAKYMYPPGMFINNDYNEDFVYEESLAAQEPMVMSGLEALEWLDENPSNNARGRPINEFRLLWPAQAN